MHDDSYPSTTSDPPAGSGTLQSLPAPHASSSASSPGSPVRRTWPPPADNQRGLVCRHCGCQDFRVTYTRSTWHGRIMRRRQCRHCGKRMLTWES